MFANISLDAPEMPKTDFTAPNLQAAPLTPLSPIASMPAPPVGEAPNTGQQIAGLGSSLLALKKRYGSPSGGEFNPTDVYGT